MDVNQLVGRRLYSEEEVLSYVSSPFRPPSAVLYVSHPDKKLNLAFPMSSLGMLHRLIATLAGGGIKFDAYEKYGVQHAVTKSGFHLRCFSHSIREIVQTKPTRSDMLSWIPPSIKKLPEYEPGRVNLVLDDPREKRRLRRLSRSAARKSMYSEAAPVASSPSMNVAELARKLGLNPKACRRYIRSLGENAPKDAESLTKSLESLRA